MHGNCSLEMQAGLLAFLNDGRRTGGPKPKERGDWGIELPKIRDIYISVNEGDPATTRRFRYAFAFWIIQQCVRPGIAHVYLSNATDKSRAQVERGSLAALHS